MKTVKFLCAAVVLMNIIGCRKINMPESQSDSFVKMFGNFNPDQGEEVYQTEDGGYILIGTVETISRQKDIALIKTDKFGNEEWSNVYGDAQDDIGNSLKVVSDGYVILGTTQDTSLTTNMYLLKVNGTGAEQWSKKIGSSDDNEEGIHLETTNDNGFILIGSTTQADTTVIQLNPKVIKNEKGVKDIYMVKVNNAGEIEWSKNYGAASDDFGTYVQQINNNSYIVAGSTKSYNNEAGKGLTDAFLMLVDENGTIESIKTYGGEQEDFGIEVEVVSDGYILLGTTNSKGQGGSDIYLVKTSFDIFDIQWEQEHGGAQNDEAHSLSPTSDGNFIIGGTFEDVKGKDQYLLKIDQQGDTLWTAVHGGESGEDIIKSVQETTDGGFIFTGKIEFENNSMMNLTKTNNKGNVIN